MTRFLIIILILCSAKTFACSCNSYGDFLETIDDSKNELVIGQIIGQNDYFFQVKIDTILNGTLSSDTINLMSGNGGNCWQMIWKNDIGKNFIFSLSDLSNDSVQYYGLMECGTPKLQIIDKKVKGRISGGTFQNQEMFLSDFLEIYERKYPLKQYKINDLSINETVLLTGVGKRIGKWKIAGYTKLIIEEGEYDNEGEKNGVWKYYLIKEEKVDGRYQRETAVKKIFTYENGRLLKISEYFDKDGVKLNLGSLKLGTGQVLEYYNSGELFGKYSYINGIREGESIEYKKGYTVKGNYINGQRQGTWKSFENGILVLKEIYIDGQLKEEIWIE